MRHIISAVFATILVSMALPAHSMTGNELKTNCQNYSDSSTDFRSGVCAGFILGSLESTSIWTSIASQIPYCIPENATNGQLIAVVRKYLDTNLEVLHQTGTTLIIDAMMNAFPCKNEQ